MQKRPSANPAIPFTVGVTGHRNLSRVEEERIRPFLDEFLFSHAHKHPDLPIRLLSGMAEGADRIVARVFIEVKKRLISEGHTEADKWQLIATLPFAEEAYRNDFPESSAEFSELISAADDVVTITHQPLGDLQSNPDKRDDGYEAQGHYMLRHSHLIIALWDGIHLDLRGGTSHVVRLKISGHDNPDSPFLAQDCGPVYHIPVQRGEPAVGKNFAQPQLIFPTTFARGSEELESLKCDLEGFNRSVRVYSDTDEIRKSISYLAPDGESGAALLNVWLERSFPFDRKLIDLYAAADTMAIRHDRLRIILLRALYGCGVILAMSLWTGLDRIAQGWMIGFYLGALALIFALYTRLKQHDLSKGQLEYRLLAEALRAQIYLRMLDGIIAEPEHLADDEDAQFFDSMVLDALLSQQAMEIGWVREALRLCGMDKRPLRLSQQKRTQFINHWVNGQYRYFEKTERRYNTLHLKIRRLTIACAISGIVSAATVVWIDQNELSEIFRHVPSIAAATFPAVALLLESYKDRMAIEEQAKNAARMSAVFGRFKERVDGIGSDKMPSAGLVRALAQEALSESVNWLILRRSKPAVLPT